MAAYDFEMYAGNSREQPFAIVDGDGVAVDVSTAQSITYVIASSVDAETTLVTKTLADGISVLVNTFTVSLEPEDTADLAGTYYHEIQIVDAPGNSLTATGYIVVKRTRIS